MIFKTIKAKKKRSKYAKANKVFCIGRNKTGTTSIAKIFNEIGLDVAPQEHFELLIKDWYKNDFSKIITSVKYKGISFQDIPFSLPKTFEILDNEFPNSKFILTVRDSPEAWYKSLTTFHAKLFGNGKMLCWEAMVEKALENSSLWRADLMSDQAWSLHPGDRSEKFYNLLPEIIESMNRNEFPAEQRGHFDLKLNAWEQYLN